MIRKTSTATGKTKKPRAAATTSRAKDQRQIILEVAERLCGEHGLEAVSVRDIASEAGCNLAAINYYFGSRQNLLLTIFKTRGEEITGERQKLLAPLMAQAKPNLRELIRAMLTPLARWRMPGSERRAALQFICRALTAADPDIRNEIDNGVRAFQQIIPAFQRAVPQLSFEEACWCFHFMMSIEHMNPWDVERLEVLSKGKCRATSFEETLERAVTFAEAGFRAALKEAMPLSKATR